MNYNKLPKIPIGHEIFQKCVILMVALSQYTYNNNNNNNNNNKKQQCCPVHSNVSSLTASFYVK
jgi:hypothetical protein